MNELQDIIFPVNGEKKMTETVKRTVKYEIYKGKGAMQFKLAPAWTIRDKRTGEMKDKGCIFLDAAPTVGKHANGRNQYGFKDDSKKITFALSEHDIGEVLVGFKVGKFQLTHDPHAQTEKRNQIRKNFSMWRGNDNDDGTPTFFLKLTEDNNNVKKEVTIPLTAGEARVLSTLLESALPRILYWT